MKENIFAIPSKDRLRYQTMDLFLESGIPFYTRLNRLMAIEAKIPEVGRLIVALMRPKDIVQMVAAGDIPLGIVGWDTVEEYRLGWRGSNSSRNENQVQTLLQLGIGRCRLVLAVPEGSELNSNDLMRGGLTIATSFPGITREYFIDTAQALDTVERLNFTLEDRLTGSVEAAPALGMADAIADIVETGRSLKENGLKEIVTIFESQGVLITGACNRKGTNRLVDAIRDRLFATLLRRNNPDAIRKQEIYDDFIASYR